MYLECQISLSVIYLLMSYRLTLTFLTILTFNVLRNETLL